MFHFHHPHPFVCVCFIDLWVPTRECCRCSYFPRVCACLRVYIFFLCLRKWGIFFFVLRRFSLLVSIFISSRYLIFSSSSCTYVHGGSRIQSDSFSAGFLDPRSASCQTRSGRAAVACLLRISFFSATSSAGGLRLGVTETLRLDFQAF